MSRSLVGLVRHGDCQLRDPGLHHLPDDQGCHQGDAQEGGSGPRSRLHIGIGSMRSLIIEPTNNQIELFGSSSSILHRGGNRIETECLGRYHPTNALRIPGASFPEASHIIATSIEKIQNIPELPLILHTGIDNPLESA